VVRYKHYLLNFDISLGQAMTPRGLTARPGYFCATGRDPCPAIRSRSRDSGHVTMQSWILGPATLWVSSPPRNIPVSALQVMH